MSNTINWGILSTGAIANCFARNLPASRTGKLLAVASRDKAKADKFAADFKASKSYGSYEELLADKEVHAVYIAPPHPYHAEWTIKALNAKKHVLIEKPMGMNAAQAMAMIEAAKLNGVMLMEAFMYRCHPQTAKVIQLIKSGAIGQVRAIRASFGWNSGKVNPAGRTFNNDLGGGGILDVGCYCTSMARLVAGAAAGKDFAEPVSVTGAAHLGETGVDEWAYALMKFPGDIVAQLATSVMLAQDNNVVIDGSEGRITIPIPWVANREKADNGKIILRKGGKDEEIEIPATVTSFTMEADVFGDAVLAGKTQAPSPAMTWDDTIGNARALDQWRNAIRLVYDQEKPIGYPKVKIDGSSMSRPAKTGMKYGRVPGLNKEVSRLVMGCDNQQSLPHAAIMFDDWFEKGGNAFDTSFIYGGGLQEQLLGQWMKLRGVRDQCVVMVKGLHTPDCYPERLGFELPKSLERLQTTYADIYVMHRDNVKVPVGEFVEVINEHINAGRIRVWGGSNWTPARFEEARDYAKKKGLQPPVAMSNNFSLAAMMHPIWDGCIAASDPDSRAWLTAHKDEVALLPWSSQARGFFVPGLASPEKIDDKEMVKTWYSDANFERQKRAFAMAEKKNVQPINIALAYVLCQPFPTFPLIGPRQLSETRTSLPALDLELTPQEVKWLNLEVDSL